MNRFRTENNNKRQIFLLSIDSTIAINDSNQDYFRTTIIYNINNKTIEEEEVFPGQSKDTY